MFEVASKVKLRFDTGRGASITVEDLWDLPLTSRSVNAVTLDSVAVAVDKKLRDSGTVSFVKKAGVTKEQRENELRMEILRYIIEVKQNEVEEKERKLVAQSQKDKLDALIQAKEDQKLLEMDLEALKQMRNGL
jgi:hypothetical protein